MGRPLREDNVTVSPESARKVKSGAGSPSTAGKTASKRRAVGIVRVSHVGGRGGESFVSPDQQRDRIRDACRAQGLRLVDTFEELDISGKRPIEQRPGLFRAVQMIEAERAEVIVVAYMDRLVRKLKVQLEVVERVERAGGEILTLDHGALTNGNARATPHRPGLLRGRRRRAPETATTGRGSHKPVLCSRACRLGDKITVQWVDP